MGNILSTTMKVPKSVAEEIKIYCQKSGKPIGDWVETAWNFIKKNDFDIYDTDNTPCLPVEERIQEEASVNVLCRLMSEFIIHQKQLPPPELLAEVREDRARAVARAEELAREVERLQREVVSLQEYKEKAYRELCRVRNEQKTIGKIKINTEL